GVQTCALPISDRGEYEQAESLYQQALHILQQTLGPDILRWRHTRFTIWRTSTLSRADTSERNCSIRRRCAFWNRNWDRTIPGWLSSLMVWQTSARSRANTYRQNCYISRRCAFWNRDCGQNTPGCRTRSTDWQTSMLSK